MPHAELKYSADIDLNADDILAAIEGVIQRHDAGSGACKGRAYPASAFHHTHVLVDISMLPKDHRDQAFIDALVADLETAITSLIPTSCYFSLNVGFSSAGYVTREHCV